MGTKVTLKAADGHSFEAYVAEPKGTPRGAIVVIQEIFGVNSHIRGVADGYAADGYLAVAPALESVTAPPDRAAPLPAAPIIVPGMLPLIWLCIAFTALWS